MSHFIADTERLSSSRAVNANLETRLAKLTDTISGNDNREEPLGVREAKLKEEIEEKIRLLHRKNQFKSLGIHDFDVEAHKVNGERCGEELVKFRENGDGIDVDNGNVLKAELGNERHKLEVVKNSGVVDGEACAVGELKGENVKDSAERKRLACEPSKKDGLGSSGMEFLTASLLTICIHLVLVFANNICILEKTIEVMGLR